MNLMKELNKKGILGKILLLLLIWYLVVAGITLSYILFARFIENPDTSEASSFILSDSDYINYYYGGETLKTGNLDNLYDFDAQKAYQENLLAQENLAESYFKPFRSPPLVAAAFIPFTLVSYQSGMALFMFFNIALLALTTLFYSKDAKDYLKNLALVLLFFPVLFSFIRGQHLGIFTSLLGVALLLDINNKKFLSGMVLGIFVLRPQLVFLLPIIAVLQRNKKQNIGMLISIFILFLLNLLVGGVNSIHEFVAFLSIENTAYGANLESAISIEPIIALFTKNYYSYTLIFVSVSMVLILAFLYLKKFNRRISNTPQKYLISSLLAIAFTPHAFAYETSIIIFPLLSMLVLFRGSFFNAFVLLYIIPAMIFLAKGSFNLLNFFYFIFFSIYLLKFDYDISERPHSEPSWRWCKIPETTQ